MVEGGIGISNGLMATVGAIVAGLAMGGLHLKKMWRTEGTEARNAAREQSYLDGVTARLATLEERVLTLMNEKTEAEKKAIRLEAEIIVLRNKIQSIEDEKRHISDLLRQVEQKYAKVLDENELLRKSIEVLRNKIAVNSHLADIE